MNQYPKFKMLVDGQWFKCRSENKYTAIEYASKFWDVPQRKITKITKVEA